MKYIAFFLILFWTNALFAQKVKIKSVLDDIFCRSGISFNYDTLYVIKSDSSVFDYYSKADSSCLEVIVCPESKDLLPYLKKSDKRVRVLHLFEKQEEAASENEKVFLFSIAATNLKFYDRKMGLLFHQGDYRVYLKKNLQTGQWELFKTVLPPAMEDIRQKNGF